MKKVIGGTIILVLGLFLWNYLYYYRGVVYLPHDKNSISCLSKVQDDTLYLFDEQNYQEFQIKGVQVGFSKPGCYATEQAVTKEEYLVWFEQIQQMGANLISVEKVGSRQFYDAFYEYNVRREDHLYLMQGVAIDDYLINSIYGAFDDEFYDPFLQDCKTAVDAVHGRLKVNSSTGLFPVHYNKDVSPWVYGYILGGEWETNLVAYTDHSYEQKQPYEGTYLYTTEATNFEIFLAQIGDELIRYETEKYGTQKTISFTNWTMTDPLEYEEDLKVYFKKAAGIDVEHIRSTERFLAGQFASYHVYPAYPDFYGHMDVHETNTYKQYLSALTAHHSMPVVISGFGASSARALSADESSLGRSQGHLNETQQGEAIISMYDDLMNAGCAGGIIYEWQDEWYKTTWNSLAAVNSEDEVYWINRQSCEQSYGLLSFDPGEEQSVCYVDADISEWGSDDLVWEEAAMKLSMKYDESGVYFMVEQPGYRVETDKLYIPIDITPKSGSTVAENLGITMSAEADFCIEINGTDNSRVWVQDRYNMLSALFYEDISAQNFFSKEFPPRDSREFTRIHMLQQEELYYEMAELDSEGSLNDRQITFKEYDSYNPYHYKVKAYYETGKLQYGNANPNAQAYDSLADFCAKDGFVEIRIPWQLLNVADPVKMFVHDDYYENYGVEYLSIRQISVGAGSGNTQIRMMPVDIKPIGKLPAYHERLKKSYDIIKNYWKKKVG